MKRIRQKWREYWKDDTCDMEKRHLSQHDKRALLYGGFMVSALTFILISIVVLIGNLWANHQAEKDMEELLGTVATYMATATDDEYEEIAQTIRHDLVYSEYGQDIENTLLRPTLSEKVNAVIAEYPIEAFVEKRAEISDRINTTFANQVAGSGILVKSLLITSHDFSDEFNKAIEDKKIAEQGALTAKFTLERMKLEAEAQKVKQASLSEMVLQEMAINKWDGKLPQYFSGDQLPFITIK